MQAKDLLLSVAAAAVTALLISGAYLVGRFWLHEGSQNEPKPQRDTIYLRDTITVAKPVYLTRREIDTVYVPVLIPGERDTVVVPLVREQVEWQDSLATVWASGVAVEVDSVRHYTQQLIITERVPVPERKAWGLGVTAGYGVSKQGLSPFIGVGVSWTPFRW